MCQHREKLTLLHVFGPPDAEVDAAADWMDAPYGPTEPLDVRGLAHHTTPFFDAFTRTNYPGLVLSSF